MLLFIAVLRLDRHLVFLDLHDKGFRHTIRSTVNHVLATEAGVAVGVDDCAVLVEHQLTLYRLPLCIEVGACTC